MLLLLQYLNLCLPLEEILVLEMEGNSTQVKTLIHSFVNKNDEEAFTTFFKLYYARLVEYSMIFVKEEFKAKEVVSDVFFKLLKNKQKLLGVNNISAYLFFSCKNQSITHLKKDKIYHHNPLDFQDNEVYANIGNPEEEIIAKEFQLLVDQTIENLPPKRRVVFKLIKDDGLSYKEVASLLDISVKTVDNHLSTAIAELRKVINKYRNMDGQHVIMKVAQMILLLGLAVISL